MTAADELVEQLARDQLELPASAAHLLELYAAQIATARDARHRVEAEGEVVPGPRDEPVAHPSLAVERSATAAAKSLHGEIMKTARRVKRR